MLSKIPLRGFVYTAVSLNLVTALSLILLKKYLPPVVPILYGRPTGESQLVSSFGLLIPLAVSILIVVINSVIAVFSKNVFLKKVLVLSTFLISLLTTIAVLKVVLLVGLF